MTEDEYATLAALLDAGGPVRRVLVTGSQTWTDEAIVDEALGLVHAVTRPTYTGRHITLVHGDARIGADRIAKQWAAGRPGWTLEPHPAAWNLLGRRAGMVRNAEMVRTGADICLAFIRDGSPGATACADMAERAGIPAWRCRR